MKKLLVNCAEWYVVGFIATVFVMVAVAMFTALLGSLAAQVLIGLFTICFIILVWLR